MSATLSKGSLARAVAAAEPAANAPEPAAAGIARTFSLKDVPGWAISLGLHGAVVLALSIWAFAIDNSEETSVLSALEEITREIEFDSALTDQVGTSAEVNQLLNPGSVMAAAASSVQDQAEASLERQANDVDPDVSLSNDGPELPPEGDFSGTVETTGGTV